LSQKGKMNYFNARVKLRFLPKIYPMLITQSVPAISLGMLKRTRPAKLILRAILTAMMMIRARHPIRSRKERPKKRKKHSKQMKKKTRR
jgi:hypothetical protein